MMQSLLSPLQELADYKKIKEIVRGGNSIHKPGTVSYTGCVDAQKLHLIAGLGEGIKTKVIVTYDELRARNLYEEYSFYDRNVYLYPGKDLIFFQADMHGNQVIRERLRTLRRLLEGKPLTIITTFGAMMTPQVVFSRENSVISLEKGGEVNQSQFAKRLVELGYEKMPQVESPGQFSIRGDIIDIFDLTEENPYRVELWGDEIESIRSFDALTQRSMENLSTVKIYPATEYVLTRQQKEEGVSLIKEEAARQVEALRKIFKTEEAHRLDRSIKEFAETFLEFGGKVNLESYASYFYKEGDGEGMLTSFPALLERSSFGSLAYFVEEPLRAKEQGEALELEFRESYIQRLEKGYSLPGQKKLIYSGAEIAAKIENFANGIGAKKDEKKGALEGEFSSGGGLVLLSTLDSGPGYFSPVYKMDVGARNISSYHGSFDSLTHDLNQYRKKKYKVLLVSPSRTRAKRLAEDLRNLDISAVYSDDPFREVIEGEVLVIYGRISKGFEYPLIKFVVLTESDIFGAPKEKKKRKKTASLSGQKISSLEDLKPGDYVVHENYGLGIYRDIEKVESGHVVRDYIKLEYREGGILYVLATELDAIQKYASADAEKVPKINKLGTKEWEKTRSKVRTAVEVVAKDLVELYAKRQQTEGYRYGEDTVWQQEFEELFPYEETEDQLLAIRDTKADMESNRIMDRLICGDVGFGKTEIAIRAAFKAVQEGKQVAYLVPTTILAQQHYNTFTQRMADFPVGVALLSRFRTPSEIKKSITELKKGLVDIVIGTHRLLSNDVEFKDLGLLIIDEEQRFGVTHKEKIKKLKENVDVLTLSATPIPRTLHMSLVGIRDMSLLEEAPSDRLPIQTFVCEYDEQLVCEAITRELSRGGQVYYVYNRINKLADICARLQAMLPEANIAYAHGQMPERDLENIMYDFISGDIDVLVSTTIVETGMDISNVNTLIIQDSDRMGLSQLYQLRGRVGRSNRMAYAFLMYSRDKILTEVAEKRLEAIREFTDLGSGYKIAMRDLEIRGAGNLLGKSQHGHMEAVGYDLYCRMLNEEVGKLKGIPVEENFTTVINLDVDAYLPGEYIFNEEQKLDMYKRIALIESEKEQGEMRDELMDRFGELPLPAENLLRIALIRHMAHNLDMLEVRSKGGKITFVFKPDARLDASEIPNLMNKHMDSRKDFLDFGKDGKNPCFTYKYPREVLVEKEEQQLLALTEQLLEEMQVMKPADAEEAKSSDEK